MCKWSTFQMTAISVRIALKLISSNARYLHQRQVVSQRLAHLFMSFHTSFIASTCLLHASERSCAAICDTIRGCGLELKPQYEQPTTTNATSVLPTCFCAIETSSSSREAQQKSYVCSAAGTPCPARSASPEAIRNNPTMSKCLLSSSHVFQPCLQDS